MFIPDPDPDFYPSRIMDRGTKNSNKREGRKNLCSHRYHKILTYFIFELVKEKFGQIYKEL
jgi:hypothetical protein